MKTHISSVFLTALLGALLALSTRPTQAASTLYVANWKGDTITQFTSAGVGSAFASGGGLQNPLGLAFDSAGNLYASSGNNTIVRFASTGGVLSSTGSVFASSGLSGADGLAFDSAGNLYAANFGSGTIQRFTPGGVGSVFASTGVNHPWGLAFAPDTESVPEPSRALLLAAGLGVTVLRRRR